MLLVTLCLWNTSGQGAETDFLDLPLGELAQVRVASKRLESVVDAPGVVSIISADEISRFGARHLRDVIDRLPNTQVIGSQLYTHNRTSLRGVTQTHLDDKILVLLNGRPIRDAGQGGVNGDLYSSFPIELIQQIEVIRGPGSVLYGTNAFAGVINIVTRDPPEKVTTKVSVSYGSFETKEATVSSGGSSGDFSFIGALTAHDSEGDTFSGTGAELGPAGDFETGREALETVIQASYKQLTVNAIINKVLQKSGNNLLSFPSEDWNISRRFIDVGYKHDLSADWDLLANVTYNGMNNTAGIVGGADRFFRTKSRGYLAELSVHGHIGNNMDLVSGGIYDRLKGDNVSDGTLNTDIDTWRSSFYSQLDYRINEQLKISAGFQLNKPEDGDTDLSPRLVGIFKLSDAWLLKLMYGEAYRSPFGLDLFLDATFLLGNPDLKPETIDTYSSQLLYQRKNVELALTYYSSRHEDLIVRTIDNSGQVTLTNQGHIDYDGLEFEYKWRISPSLNALGNASYQTNETDGGATDTTFQPNWMVKGGLSYESGAYQAGLFASYFGEPTQLVEFDPGMEEVNPDAEAYVLLTANLSVELREWLQDSRYSGLSVALYADNLLDERIYYPEISRQVINTIPSHAGRGFYLTMSYNF